jgi:hypothetical protein
MNRRVLPIAIAISLSFASGVLVGGSSHHSNHRDNPAMASDPAYRDGLYQARLDVRDGRRPHLAVGRWPTEAARASFVAGYQEGYRQSTDSPNSSLYESSVAQLAASGFRDGMLDGTWHRMASQPFQADQTPHYREAGLNGLSTAANAEMYKNFYREAYLHGYQQAYYSSAK